VDDHLVEVAAGDITLFVYAHPDDPRDGER
jgi:hypothetical protein